MEVTGYYPNLNNYEEVEKVIKEIQEKYGTIDILVNNAGISANKKIEETTSEDFTKIMEINVKICSFGSFAIISVLVTPTLRNIIIR